MKKTLILLIITLLSIASVASAVVDPHEDSMGFYFDTNADFYEFHTAPYVIVSVFLVLTNPTADALYGYEFGWEFEGNYLQSSLDLGGIGPITTECWPEACVVGLAAPMPLGQTNIVATFSIFVLDSEPIRFKLKGAIPSSVGDSRFPVLLLEGNTLLATGLSAWDDATQMPAVCAVLNPDTSPVAADETTWDRLKSHYR